MLFNSLEYLIFLPTVFLLYWLVFYQLRWQNLLIVVASYLFYGWWDWRFLILIAFTTFCSYLSGLQIERCRTSSDKVQKIKDEIDKYATDADLTKMIDIIKEMHFYEKIMIHQLSHGSSPMPVFSQKEVEDAINLIMTLESLIKQFHPAKSNSIVGGL